MKWRIFPSVARSDPYAGRHLAGDCESIEDPGIDFGPKLQPIQTRLVMLQTGMRAPMGIKVYGPDLETIEKTGYRTGKSAEKSSRRGTQLLSLPTGWWVNLILKLRLTGKPSPATD